MLRKPVLRLFILFFLSCGLMFFPATIHAASRIGPNMSSDYTYEGVQNQIHGAYGGDTTATILIDIDCASRVDCLRGRKGNLQKAGITNPIIRISNNGNAISDPEAATTARNLVQIFPGAVVEFGNEVNNIEAEWKGGTFDSYGRALTAFINAAAGGLQILPAALDPFFDEGGPASAEKFISSVYGSRRGSTAGIAGLAFNVYQAGWAGEIDCPQDAAVDSSFRKTRCSWIWLKNEYEKAGLGRNSLILTEYSLAPGEDRDLSQVIKFIDTTKQHMLDRGVLFITPLIKNPCSTISWPWLLWADGSPSRIMDPNIGTDLSQKQCSQNTDISDCAPISQAPATGTSGGGILNFFAGLLSFFAPPPPTDLTATCADVTQDLTANPDPYGRTAGKPFCDKPKTQTVTLTTGSGAKQQNYLLGFIGDLFQNFTRKSTVGGYVPDYSVSDQTPGVEQLKPDTQTVRGYLGGPFSPGAVSKRIAYRTSTDPNKTPPNEFYENAGILAKLSPHDCKSVNGEWKPCEDAWRDAVLAAVMRGYMCGLSGKHCEGEKSHDVPLGWLTLVNETARGQAESGAISMPELPGYETTVVDSQLGNVSRPFMASEIACTNPNYKTDDISHADVIDVCNSIMGAAHDGGYIHPGTILANALKYWQLRSPGDDVKYGYGRAWDRMPTSVNDDIAADVSEDVNPKDKDPKDPRLSRSRTIGIPGVMAAVQLTDYVGSFFTSPDTLKNRKPYQLSQNQCLKNAVSGRINDPVAGTKFEEQSYTAGAQIGSSLGITSDNTSPANSKPTSSSQSKTYTFNRGESVSVRLTDDIPTLVSQTSGPDGFLRWFLPSEVGKKLDTAVGGTPIAALGTSLKVDCGPDFACDQNSGTPGIGGPLIAGLRPGTSVVSELILPYKANSKQTSISQQIFTIAKEQESLVVHTPWEELASFNYHLAIEEIFRLTRFSSK